VIVTETSFGEHHPVVPRSDCLVAGGCWHADEITLAGISGTDVVRLRAVGSALDAVVTAARAAEIGGASRAGCGSDDDQRSGLSLPEYAVALSQFRYVADRLSVVVECDCGERIDRRLACSSSGLVT
jgi:hypothetical protein